MRPYLGVTIDTQVLNLQCAVPYTFHGKFVASCLLPLIALLAIQVLGCHFARRESSTEALQEAFDAADTDGSGALDKEEMCLAISLLQLEVTPAQVRRHENVPLCPVR